MRNGTIHTAVRWTGVGLGAMVVFVAGTIPAAAQTGMNAPWEPTAGHLARTIAHLIGVVGGAAVFYYADRVRRRTGGSTLGWSVLVVQIATGLFVLVFFGMEAQHIAGVKLWYFADTMAVTQLWYMLALGVVMLLYTLAYRNLVVEMGG